MAPIRTTVLAALALAVATGASGTDGPPARPRAGVGPAYGTYAWPVQGPVIRGFDPGPGPYGRGHRGIDIGAPFGSAMVAAADGVVAFAGSVAGSLYISIDHPDGVRSTYSWVSGIQVSKGDVVVRGQLIGRTGQGHPGVEPAHLHFGTRVGSVYLDPMLLLERGSVVGLIHLAPLSAPRNEPGTERGAPTMGDLDFHHPFHPIGSRSVQTPRGLARSIPAVGRRRPARRRSPVEHHRSARDGELRWELALPPGRAGPSG